MSGLYNRITSQRVLIWLITALGIVLAPVIAYFVCTFGLPLVFITFGLICVAAWAFIARDRWWVPFPGALAMGGTFYYGFKIPMHEMALMICLFPLVLALATRWQGAIPGRSHPPPSVFLLAVYILLHWVGSLIYNTLAGYGGATNTTRSYMVAFWPMILFFSYYFFGNSKYAGIALFLMYWCYIVRVGMGIFTYYVPSFMYIPGINFLPSTVSLGGDTGGGDLRASCQGLALISLCYASFKKGTFLRAYHTIVFFACFPVLMLGGNRVSLLSICILPFFWLFLYRKIFLLLVLGVIAGSGIVLLNVEPDIVNQLPDKMQRSVSGFVFRENVLAVQDNTELSNEWHSRLQEAGRKRWLSSISSILIGNGFRPFTGEGWDPNSFEDMIKVATMTCRYESALWTILAGFGLVGLILYINVFRFFLIDSLPQLWRKKICDYQTAFAFMAVYDVFMWVILSPIAGGYPSMEIMFSLFAKTLHDDQVREELEAEQKKKGFSSDAMLPKHA